MTARPRSNQGHTMTLHTYIPELMSKLNILPGYVVKSTIISPRNSKGQYHREKPWNEEVRVDMLVQRDRF